MQIQELLSEIGVDYRESGHHHCRPGWIQIKCCPFCNSDNFHLGFNLAGRYFVCWRCRGHYGPKVLEALGIPRAKARLLFPQLDTSVAEKRERKQISLVEPKGRGPLQRSHRDYLESRGFNPDEMIRLWKLEGIGLHSNLAWRIYIPIIYHDQRISWTARAIGDRVTQRYISASAEEEVMNHKETLYGGDYCSHSIIIVEGPTDVWKIGPGAGGLFGTAFTPAQVRKLIEIPRRVICFDSDPTAQARALELANQLSCFPGVTENLRIDSKDPGSASPKEIRLIRQVAHL